MNRRKKAVFRFYAELNDFLPYEHRQKDIDYYFWGSPAVKDAIEALGVPHPEVDLILVNNQPVDFSYHLQAHDRVSVYPVFELFNISTLQRLRPSPLRMPRFIADVNLGKLARNLRMLGLDTLYQNNYSDQEIVEIATKEHRIILTRDQGLLKNKRVTHGYWIRNTEPYKQTEEVLQKFDLFNHIKPFSRCLLCNSPLKPVAKETIQSQLPPKVRDNFDYFQQCPTCGKIYWQGTHFKRMNTMIQNWQKSNKNQP